MTLPYEADKFEDACRTTAACLLGCGLDPEKMTLFRQSAVRQHSELQWILGCVTPLGWLNRMTQFKQKAGGSSSKSGDSKLDAAAADGAGLGLYAYPVLQAADILLYRGTEVPVGEDQHQHIELARDIATTFNSRFCGITNATLSEAARGGARKEKQAEKKSHEDMSPAQLKRAQAEEKDLSEKEIKAAAQRALAQGFYLPPPKTVSLPGEAKRVMSLRHASKKMSKSDPSDYTRINLIDSDDAIREKIKKATTDNETGFTFDPEKRPEKSNLLTIFSGVTGRPVQELAAQYATSSAVDFKKDLADALIAHLSPLRGEALRLMADKGHVDAVLKQGAETANEIAAETMMHVRRVTGLVA
jgi:tryptophanyl-tRNA synthetase